MPGTILAHTKARREFAPLVPVFKAIRASSAVSSLWVNDGPFRLQGILAQAPSLVGGCEKETHKMVGAPGRACLRRQRPRVVAHAVAGAARSGLPTLPPKRPM